MVHRKAIWGLLLILALVPGCSRNPYIDAALQPAELEGKDQAWFEEHWGPPSGKAPRFFGGEQWTYFRIAGGTAGGLGYNYKPNECQITLKFDKEGKLSGYSQSGC